MTVTIRQTYHNTVDQDHDNLTSHLSSRFFNSSAPLQTVSTGPSGGAVCDVGLRPLACWDCGLEYRRRECTCVSCKCCVLSGRGLSDGLTTRPDEFYWSWCVRVWSWSWGDPGPLGVVAPWGKKKNIYIYVRAYFASGSAKITISLEKLSLRKDLKSLTWNTKCFMKNSTAWQSNL